MKKLLLSASFVFALVTASAQTPTPYYSGFDTPAEQAGWQLFRTGYTTTFAWTLGTSMGTPSPPNSYSHDYPVGGAPTPVIDWMVSPAFDFSGGGKVTSFKALVFAITGTTMPDDHFGVYLINGSPDPATGTVTMLQDLTSLVTSTSNWVDVSTINIPPTSGTSYVAFKYIGKDNWFTTYFDNVNIDAGPVCPKVASVNITPLTTSASVTWPAVAGSAGYEYVCDMIIGDPPVSSTIIGTGNTFANLTGLTANTTYYIHVRNSCGTGSSKWLNQAFYTKPVPPACMPPLDLVIDNLTTTSVSFSWPVVSFSDGYEYVVKEGSDLPGNSGSTTMLNHASASGLKTGFPYHLFVRTRCDGESSRVFSNWSSKEFFVPFPTGISGTENTNLRIYPNPTSDVLNIECNEIGNITVSIKNISGKTVASFAGTGNLKADISHLPAGMYITELTTSKEHTITPIIKK